ncbi:VOC family protein [Legionella sp. D16C41]|uniref:VOC family protein n=1 Tax=Legionella sp. D16C41 TaxID=3402688 RepID=UPI003AF7F194
MILKPAAVVMYVDNLIKSERFYQNLLGLEAEEASPTFRMFKLANDLGLGLKDAQSVEHNHDDHNQNELVFSVENNTQVEALAQQWQKQGAIIIQPPNQLSFGYTFLALDPNGNRLRILSLGK